MSYEEEFDKIMRQKAGEMDYPFEEAHWEKAQAMMPNGRAGGSELMRSLLWSGAVVVAGGIATMLWFGDGEKLQTKGDKGLTAYASGGPSTARGVTAAAAIPASQVEFGAAGAGQEAPDPIARKSSETREPASSTLNKEAKRFVSAASSKSSGRMHGSISRHVQVGPGKEESTQHSSGEIDIASAAPDQQLVPINRVSDFLQSTEMFLDYHQTDNDVRFVALNRIKRDDDYVPKKRHTRLFAEVAGGAAFWTGWHSDGSHDGRGINWFGGVNIGLSFSGKWQLISGMQVFNFAHIDAPFYAAKRMSYGFGSVANSTVITTREMRYIGVPLSIGYSFKSGSQIRAGVIGAQLWHATNTVETSSLRDGETSESHSSSNHKLYDGMNQQVLMVSGSYHVRLARKVNAGVEIVYGLTDLFSERTYLQRAERPLMIRAGLTFRFLEK